MFKIIQVCNIHVSHRKEQISSFVQNYNTANISTINFLIQFFKEERSK